MPLQRKRSWMNWDGCEPIAAWQPLYAPSRRDSFLTPHGTSLTDTGCPWNNAGWLFPGGAANMPLDTTIVPAAQSWSYLVLLSGADTSVANRYCFGRTESGSTVVFAVVGDPGTSGYFNGGSLAVAPPTAAGVMGIAGATAYRNGLAEPGSMSSWTGSSNVSLYIGGVHDLVNTFWGTFSVGAVGIYNITLSSAQMWQRARMLAHLDNPDWSVWGRRRQYYFAPTAAAFQAAWAERANRLLGGGN